MIMCHDINHVTCDTSCQWIWQQVNILRLNLGDLCPGRSCVTAQSQTKEWPQAGGLGPGPGLVTNVIVVCL